MKEVLADGGKAEFKVTRDDSTTMRNDNNNVDADLELARLSTNAILYRALAEQIDRKFSQLRLVIREGR